MMLLIKISLRNLLRQKQRNILLGIGVAFGMMILILSNAFSHGLTDILLNRIVKLMTGHFIIMAQEKPEDRTRMLLRDHERLAEIIRESVEGDVSVYEGLTTQTAGFGQHGMNQALGNGSSSIIIVIGLNQTDFMEQQYEVISGRLEDVWEDKVKENPIVVYDTIAENLNVKMNDTIRVRFSTVYGQVQAARFTIVCILKSTNPFMSVAAFTSQETLKPLVGMQPYETGSLSVVINNLDDATKVIEQARRLHDALKPGAAGSEGEIVSKAGSQNALLLGISSDKAKQSEFAQKVQVSSGNVDQLWTNENSALISEELAGRLKVGVGSRVSYTYPTKFEGKSVPQEIVIKGVFAPNSLLADNVVILHPQLVYNTFIPVVPKVAPALDRNGELFPYLVAEWRLLELSPDQDSMRKKYSNLRDETWHGRVLDVVTMYAVASEILQLESVLKMITLVAVLVLFFIILIGVINTLRMTIRERTREIGTIRAIGMQRSDVRWVFLLEVIFLALFASIVGTIVSFIVMKGLALITFKPEGMFSIFLVDYHLHFLPTVADIITNLIIIVVITAVTAIIPANRASKLSVAEALRHVE